MTVILEGLDDFNLDTLQRVAWDGEQVAFGAQALGRMRAAREQFLNLLEFEPNLHIYGVTTATTTPLGRSSGRRSGRAWPPSPSRYLQPASASRYRGGS